MQESNRIVINSLILSLLFCCINVLPTARCRGDEIQNLYREMHSAIHVKNLQDTVELLHKLDSTNVWSFGAGLGPTDDRFLQVSLIRDAAVFLSSDNGGPHSDIQLLASKSGSAFGNWPELLSVLPGDEQGMLRLLQDQNPAVRWLGLYKASFLKDGTPSLRKAASTSAIAVFSLARFSGA